MAVSEAPLDIATPAAMGIALRAARKRLGMSQADAALAAGVGVRFLSDLENGKETVHLGKVLRVVEGLGLTLVLAPRTAAWSGDG